MSQCKHGTVSWADCSVCKTERIAELEAANIELIREGNKHSRRRIAELEMRVGRLEMELKAEEAHTAELEKALTSIDEDFEFCVSDKHLQLKYHAPDRAAAYYETACNALEDL